MCGALGRESQFQALRSALGPSSDFPQSLMLWGLPSTGKTYILNQAIEKGSIFRMARLSATEIMCGRRPFFETLLRQLQPEFEGELKCENLRLFLRNLRTIHYHTMKKDSWVLESRIVIILDEAEHLRKEHSDILNVFANLQEFTQSNICVIFTSTLSPLSFSAVTNMRSIPSIHFPQYSKEDIISIITTCYYQPCSDPQLFNSYVGMVVNVFYQTCRDLKKLLRLTTSNWEYFYQQKGHETNGQFRSLHKLWKNIEPKLKEDFKALNCQFLVMSEPERKFSENLNSSRLIGARGGGGDLKPSSSKAYNDIPKYSRYILIAAYLSTENPPSSDKRFFVKGSTRKTGRKNKPHLDNDSNENASERTIASRSFDQNRLKSIFAFIVSYCSGGIEKYESNVDILVQLSSLCQSRFIQNIGEDNSGNFKYRCLADYDFILELANSVDFELDKYLYRLL